MQLFLWILFAISAAHTLLFVAACIVGARANSGEYAVEILDSDYGVGWTMRRKGVDR
jgi:hypothetical protein